MAKRMIGVAAKAGADYIKFQTFIPEKLVTADAPKAEYQRKRTGKEETQRQMLEKLCLKQNQFKKLKNECRKRGIGFLSTPFDPDSLIFVEKLRPDFHKISSGDLDNVPLLRTVARYGRPVILSTGMATIQEVEVAIKTLERAGLPRRKVIVLQCHTDYPSSPSDVNLLAMDSMRRKLRVLIGLSDHTPGIIVSLAAVARGAAVIEKHFTLNQKLPGPDHQASLEPHELASLVAGVRLVEQAIGSGVKKATPMELKNKKTIRKSLVASCLIYKGETFSASNIAVKRPGRGISPRSWDKVIGRKANRNFLPDELIEI